MSNYDPRRRGRMEWQGNLAQMKRHGTLVSRICASPCAYFERIDLDAMIALLGPDGDLWNARPPCPRCDGRNHFVAATGPGTPARPLLSWNRGPEPRRPPEGWPAWPTPAAVHICRMPTFTLVITGAADGHQHTALVDFKDAAQAIADAREALTEEHTSVAVARGSGEEIEFLGVWDREPGGAVRWTAED